MKRRSTVVANYATATTSGSIDIGEEHPTGGRSGLGASQNYSLQRLTAACGFKADPGKWSNPAIKKGSLLLILCGILCGQLHRLNVFQDGSKFRLRRETHGSISVQEGQPVIKLWMDFDAASSAHCLTFGTPGQCGAYGA
jgi:hypothetical protein